MKKISLLCMFFVLISLSLALASSLDDPAEKKVTVGSEIQRGIDVIYRVGADTTTYSTYEFTKEAKRVIAINKERNTDTDAFYLGAYSQIIVELLVRYNTFDDSKPFLKNTDKREYEFYKEYTMEYFRLFRERQKALGLSDDDVYAALKLPGNYTQIFKEKIDALENM